MAFSLLLTIFIYLSNCLLLSNVEVRIQSSALKPTLMWWGILSNKVVSTNASRKRACHSNTTTFDQSKQISFMVMPRKAFLSLVSSCSISVLVQNDWYPISNIHRFIHHCTTSFIIYIFLSRLRCVGVSNLEVKYNSETAISSP